MAREKKTINHIRRDFYFHGNWLVNYEPEKFNYLDILLSLAHIQDYFDKTGSKFNSININFNKNNVKNCFFKEKEAIFLIFNDIKREFQETGAKPTEIAEFMPLKKAIKTVTLLFPRLESDPRWKTMGLPAGHMLLASSLKASGFQPKALPLPLSGENLLLEALSVDMTGITLFEDLLPLLGPFLAVFRASYKGIIAAGGPFPTLSPLAAIHHLPPVNLFVRGEAELVLPGILQALNQGNAEALFSNTGVFWQQPGVIAMAGFDKIVHPSDLETFQVDLDFLDPIQAEHGLEMNFSRGCCRGCMFCCRVQGAKFRKLPPEKADELLKAYTKKIDDFWGSPRPLSGPPPLVKGVSIAKSATGFHSSCPPFLKGGKGGDQFEGDSAPAPQYLAVNINDDDILLDPAYSAAIFSLVKKHGLRIFGIQTSPASLVKSNGSPDLETLDLVSDPRLYVDDRPLLWLGSDAFLTARARRLGKRLPPAENFTGLLAEMEKRGLRHFHYWISSDGDSTWEEFVEELALIFGYYRGYPGFGLLAHAPFIIPYQASSLFGRIPANDPRLKIKLALEAPDPRFSYKVVERMETSWPQLNALLRNEKAGGESGFFDLLKAKDLMAAAQIAYHFLKQEQLQRSSTYTDLIGARGKLEKTIENLLEDLT